MTNRLADIAENWLEKVSLSFINFASHAIEWPRWLKRASVICGDALLCVLAVWIAFSLRLGEWRLLDWPVLRFAMSTLLVWFPVAFYQGTYSAIFRYTGRGAIVGLALAVAITSIPLIAWYMIFATYPGVPRTMALMVPLIFLMLMATARIIGRYILVDLFHSRPVTGTTQRRMIVYGAGSLGQRIAASIAAEPGLRMVGFIDDAEDKKDKRLDGFKVHHSRDVARLIARTGASDIVLAMTNVSRTRKREIVAELADLPVEVQALPPIRGLITGQITVQDIHPIKVEDLLGRLPVEPNGQLLTRSVTGKRVLVTGAGGSIGSEICRQVLQLAPLELVLAEANEFALFAISQELEKALQKIPEGKRPRLACRLVNVVDSTAVERLFSEFEPETIYHAAAYKHVSLVEDNVVAGIENNVFGTQNCALAARRHGAERFILISTDKAVRPPNVMGASKRVCELVLQALDDDGGPTIFTMVRFGNVLGSSGSVIPTFSKQIAEGGPVTVTHRDVTRYFMTIPEASQLVIQTAGMAEGGEVFVLDMGEPVRIWDLAHSMVRLAGMTKREPGSDTGDIEIVEVGLRPGEKLFEELLIGNDPLPTAHERIMRARESFLAQAALQDRLRQLRSAVVDGNAAACRNILGELVPTLVANPAPAHPSSTAQPAVEQRGNNAMPQTTNVIL